MSKKNNFIPPKKQQKSDTKKPIFWVLFFLIIFWTVSGMLGVCSFIGLSPSSDNTLTVKADSVTEDYIYNGNNFFVPTTSAYPTETDYTGSIYLLSVDVELSKSRMPKDLALEPELYFYLPRIRVYMEQRFKPLDVKTSFGSPNVFTADENGFLSFSEFDISMFGYKNGTDFVSPNLVNLNTYVDYRPSYFFYTDKDTSGYNSFYGSVDYACQYGFNGNVVSIRYYSEQEDLYEWVALSNYVEYTDKDGYIARLGFQGYFRKSSVWTGVVAWEDRTYYISNAFTDNQYYQAGLKEGYQQGKNDYTNSGYQDGFDRGFAAGESKGYNDGLLDSGNYSFLRLMTAVVDAPIQALTGLFGFELLGVNLMSVISGLFTVCVILVLLRLLLGGGLSG